ncbi:MAG: SHIRT domain-containing protein, partial [Hespellia sp.]|nr:SHIRT domain-containing protein [Hespellia sp.]
MGNYDVTLYAVWKKAYSITLTPTMTNVDAISVMYHDDTSASALIADFQYHTFVAGESYTYDDYVSGAKPGYVVVFVKPDDNYLLTGLGASGNNDLYKIGGPYGNIAGYPKISSVAAEAAKLGYTACFGYSRGTGTTTNATATFEVNGQQPTISVTASSNKTSSVKPGDTLTFTVSITPGTVNGGNNVTVEEVNVTSATINGKEYTVSNLTQSGSKYIGTITYTATEADCESGDVQLDVTAAVKYKFGLKLSGSQYVDTYSTITSSASTNCSIAEQKNVKYRYEYITPPTSSASTYPSGVQTAPVDDGKYYVGNNVTIKDKPESPITDTVNNGVWTFDGWLLNGNKVTANTMQMGASGLLFVGKWTFTQNVRIAYESENITKGTVTLDYEDVAPATGKAAGSTATAKPGYHFVEWTNDRDDKVTTSETLTREQVDAVAKEKGIYRTVTFIAHFAENKNTKYTVQHWKKSVNGASYVLADTESNLAGTTGAIATATAKTYEGFSENTNYADRVPSGIITGDGKLVLKLYYDRNSYTVSYSYENTVDGASALPETATYVYGADVTVAAAANAAGYTFSGWKTTDAAVAGGKFSMPAKAVNLSGNFTANTNTKYTVQHWKKSVNGASYVLADTESNLAGTTGAIATATAKTYEGFTENTNYADRVPSGIITGDGKLVLKLYYDRNSYTVSYSYENTVEGASALPETVTYVYGADVTVAAAASAAGYAFGGWKTTDAAVAGGKFSMPAKAVNLSGNFTANTNTKYTVQHWK